MDATILAIVCIVFFVWYWLGYSKGGKSPPGPIGFPLLGYLPFLSRKLYVDFDNIAKKYGNIFSLKLGNKYVVVLNDYPSMKAAFMQDAFMGRPKDSPFQHNKETIASQAFIGLPWKEQRSFALHMLRDLGFGKTRMEEHMREEIKELLERLKNTEGKPVSPTHYLTSSMSNNIASLVFGKKMKYNDPRRIMLDEILHGVGKYFGETSFLMFFPWLYATLSFLRIGSIEKLNQILIKFKKYLSEEIKTHESTLDPNNIRDFIDGYLLEIEKRKGDPAFNKKVLEDMLGMLFGAGSETVRISVDWLLLIVAAYPDVQKKVQAEIDEVVGFQRFPTRADHLNMPFTESVLMEQMRWRPTVPITLLRYTLADTTLQDYFIPKHSHVLSNIWAVHHNTAYWGDDTEAFRPERFLSEDKKTFRKSEYLIPFSVGKRSCPGEPFAKVEVFLYFTAILQKFDVKLPAGKTADLEGELGIGLMPKIQELCFVPREI